MTSGSAHIDEERPNSSTAAGMKIRFRVKEIFAVTSGKNGKCLFTDVLVCVSSNERHRIVESRGRGRGGRGGHDDS